MVPHCLDNSPVLRGIPLFRAVHLGAAVLGRCSATLISVCEQTHQSLFGGGILLSVAMLLITALPMARHEVAQ
jgi:hypothetical protein